MLARVLDEAVQRSEVRLGNGTRGMVGSAKGNDISSKAHHHLA